MEIKHIDNFTISDSDTVKCTVMGNIVELMYLEKQNKKQTIQLLPGGEYVILDTGEIKECEHHETRKDDKKSLYKTFARIRELVNTNVTDVNCVRWVTLTYAENMTDTKRLHNDFRKFNMRLQTYCKNHNIPQYEYIAVMEPQGRGAWHCHLLLIWDCVAPYIPNSDLAAVWGFGFVRINALNDVDNVGAYLTAYLGDIEIDDNNNSSDGDIKEIEIKTDDGKTIKKKFIKGGRLNMYPSNFNMFRHSRGIKEPFKCVMRYDLAKEKVSAGTLTYSKTFSLTDTDNDYNNTIRKEYYNLIRKN